MARDDFDKRIMGKWTEGKLKPEAAIEAYLTKGVREMGCLSFKFVSPGNNGVPDRILILPGGRVIFVELKARGKNCRELQEWQRERIRALGCDVRVVRGQKEAELLLEELRREVLQ